MHNGDSYTAPRALLILEAQAIVARFLRDFVTGIFGADCVAVDTTSGPLALTALINSSSVSQTPETRCLEFGIDYYNVGSLGKGSFMPHPATGMLFQSVELY